MPVNDPRKRDRSSGWTLRDLIDFEALSDQSAAWKNAWRSGVRADLESAATTSEKSRRRLGFKWMLEQVRGEESLGGKILNTTRLVSLLTALVMFLIGMGVVRGLLTGFSYEEVKTIPRLQGEDAGGVGLDVAIDTVITKARGFNVWVFLAVTLGLQWCFLTAGLLGYWFWRKWSGSVSLFEGLLESAVERLSLGKSRRSFWGPFKSRARGGHRVFRWRLTRLLQISGIAYNLGLLVGLFGCLWFLNVSYYWETSLPQFGAESLNRVTRIMALPTTENLPGRQAIKISQLGYRPDMTDYGGGMSRSIPIRQSANLRWSVFFFFSLVCYGLLPRVLMWLASVWMERRALAGLDFQESHHRNLWREVTKVERGEVRSGPSDGVVLLDIGGIEISTADIRPYLLQELRVNPEARFSLGTLDQEGEKQAFNAAREAAMGIVFLVEGWNLSPKQMEVYHTQVREAIGVHHTIRYLMVGSQEEFSEWRRFVDGLRDSEAEIHHYQGAEIDAAKNAT